MHINAKFRLKPETKKENDEMKWKIATLLLAIVFVILIVHSFQMPTQPPRPDGISLGKGLQGDALAAAYKFGLDASRLKNEMLNLRLQAQKLQAQINQDITEYNADQAKLNEMQPNAFKLQGLSQDTHTFDMETLEFYEKPKPPEQPKPANPSQKKRN